MHTLLTMFYSKYLFIWSGQVLFFIDNSRASFLNVEGTSIGKFLEYPWPNNVYYIIVVIVKVFRF